MFTPAIKLITVRPACLMSSLCGVFFFCSQGLEPSEVKYAQGEFKKFDMEGSGEFITEHRIRSSDIIF